MHDSLLEHKPEESLSKEEIEKAWLEYENEKKGIYNRPPAQYNIGSTNYGFGQTFSRAGTIDLNQINSSNWINALNVSLQISLRVYFKFKPERLAFCSKISKFKFSIYPPCVCVQYAEHIYII